MVRRIGNQDRCSLKKYCLSVEVNSRTQCLRTSVKSSEIFRIGWRTRRVVKKIANRQDRNRDVRIWNYGQVLSDSRIQVGEKKGKGIRKVTLRITIFFRSKQKIFYGTSRCITKKSKRTEEFISCLLGVEVLETWNKNLKRNVNAKSVNAKQRKERKD